MDLVFKAGTDVVNVKVIGKKIYFKKLVNGVIIVQPLAKLRLPIKGLLDKFPDLKGKSEDYIRQEGADRLNKHIETMESQDKIKDYVIEELESIGCKLISIIKPGHRPIVVRKNLEREDNVK